MTQNKSDVWDNADLHRKLIEGLIQAEGATKTLPSFGHYADDFGLTDEVRLKIQGNHDAFAKSFAERAPHQAVDPKPFLKSLQLLTRPQLIRYFQYEGTLTDGMELSDVVEKYPAEARVDLLQVLLLSADDE